MIKLTPMMQQYMEIKDQYPDCILLFRLGDFYETFFEDAKIASHELELVLTGKDCGLEERAPMCGVPHHAVDGYISRLVERGYKVAICEQLENPAEVKGIVKRDVTRVITPGTVVEENMLTGQDNNYIAGIYMPDKDCIGISYSDISTGEFKIAAFENKDSIISELTRIQPKEIIIPDSQASSFLKLIQHTHLRFIYVTPYYDEMFKFANASEAMTEQFKDIKFNEYKSNDKAVAVCAGGGLIQYLHNTQKNSLQHINEIYENNDSKYMRIDSSTIRNLELIQTLSNVKRKGSLLWLLDKTKTAIGARELKQLILHPFIDRDIIKERLDAVSQFMRDIEKREELAEALSAIHDLERITARISYNKLNAKNCISLKNSLKMIPEIKQILSNISNSLLKNLADELDSLPDICDLLENAIEDDAQLNITDGGIIKKGFDKDLDEVIDFSKNGRKLLVNLEEKERVATGIKNLKIRYNKVFGYYIEITKSNLNAVPYRYLRKQTLANSERYITEELKELEDQILGAQVRRNQLENDIFANIRDRIGEKTQIIQKNASVIGQLDVLQSLAKVAYENDYTRPTLNNDGLLDIKEGRHPVLEKILKDSFVPNNLYMDREKQNLLLITGPNMAGKSTYMRQTALIVLMTHIGSFVPASVANVPLSDGIFTRVGASDDLISGRSTFMVEMNELAYILKNATSNSLLLLDEIGRGTSTVDGIAIAMATIEYIINSIGSNTMFSTHYHELIDLEHKYSKIKNCSVVAKEVGNEIVFLHKIVDKGSDKSFGIEVAKLAGLPITLIDSAKNNLKMITSNEFKLINNAEVNSERTNIDISDSPILKTLKNINLDVMTPIEALMILIDLKKEYCGEDNAN